jgi:acyl-[acyl-carrier-protein] desaturase
MSIKTSFRSNAVLEKNVKLLDQYLIPVEEIWQPSDFLPNSESDNFLEEVKELREISKDFTL